MFSLFGIYRCERSQCLNVSLIFIDECETNFFRFLRPSGQEICYCLNFPSAFVIGRSLFYFGQNRDRAFTVPVFQSAGSRFRLARIVRKARRIHKTEIAPFIPCERFGYLQFIFFRKGIVRIDEFIIIKSRLRFVSHIQVVDREPLINIGQIVSRTVIHKTEPAIHRGRIEFHVFIDIGEHHISFPVSAV